MASQKTPPACSAAQNKANDQKFPPVPGVCVVTGGTGFVGQRLVEMLAQRGAKKVCPSVRLVEGGAGGRVGEPRFGR